ncbi:MAG TPA: NAD-dependent epimerase/dehydratase family protein [Woeseiaceae bacterium]|nr:NAD-dependent epimerase/dehydratase family protein [Woeseiaceae bacterium]
MPVESGIVLVTGANGRIGSAVMQRLGGQFADVVGFDRAAASPPPADCVFMPVDITSDTAVQHGLDTLGEHHGRQIASVIHLAAYYDFLGRPSPKYDEITVEGTRRLLRGLRQNFEVEQFVFASTMLVHAPGEPGEFITEDWPIEPTWAYPASKVRTEAVIHDERGDIPAVILRLAGVYDNICHSPPLAHQIQRIYERQLAGHLYSGETSHGQSFIHLDDVVDAIERAVQSRAALPAETPVLIGEPETLSYDELQHTFMRLIHGKSSETHNVPGLIAKLGAWLQNLMPGQDPFIKPWMIDRANDHYALDITRAKQLLNWRPRRTLRETLPKMVAALQDDPVGWYREHGLVPPASVKKQARPERETLHACPMHPGVSQSSSGNCPHCGTTLEPSAAATADYTCPMHPDISSSEPGRCPRCGMALELRQTEEPAHA